MMPLVATEASQARNSALSNQFSARLDEDIEVCFEALFVQMAHITKASIRRETVRILNALDKESFT